jgi:hypothetical protein
MKKLTGSQIVARYILGYLPKGYVQAIEHCNNGQNYRIGQLYIDGVIVASIPACLNCGTLPSSQELK